MLQLTEQELDWICERLPDPPRSPLGGRPSADKRRVVAGIFWILDNGAKWKDLPAEFGSKSTAHRWFKKWVQAGVFEAIMREAGSCVEQQGGYRLYECFIDATFSKAKGGGSGIGCTKVGKGVKIMVLVDARGLPVAVDTAPANHAENRLVQQLFDFMLPSQTPERVIGDKAYDSDALDAELAKGGVELISPHRSNRRPENKTQDGRPLRRYKRRWTVERTIAWLQNFRRLCIRWERSAVLFQGLLHFTCAIMLLKTVLG
jgi:transposase